MGNQPSHTHEPLDRGFTRDTYGDIKNSRFASFRFSKKSPKRMDRLRRSFRDSFRRRKDRVPESSKPLQWPTDEQAVRSSTCSFPVKYLGCVEVFESRGMHICEEALKVLRNSRRRPIRGLLHVSGDGLRVVDDDTKGLIVDQTIEKVSFCAPDRNHERGFSYICRDGTTRRWMCHGFLASKDSGERLSHAVGCAFAVCLERKQRRDTECSVTMTFDTQNSVFQRNGSFRRTTLTERLAHNERGIDVGIKTAPAAIVPPQPKPHNPYAIERPHATPLMLERQGSFRGLSSLNSQSPFKRQMSLRLSDLPSNAERQKLFLEPLANGHTIRSVSPIPEIVAQSQAATVQSAIVAPQHQEIDVVSALCKELSQGLSMLTQNDVSDELNFNLQTISANSSASTTTASDYVLPSTMSIDTISKIAVSPIVECVASDYIPMDGTQMSITTATSATIATTFTNNPYAPNRHRASVSGALPSTLAQHLQNTADNFNTNKTIATTIPTSIVAPMTVNNQLSNADQWPGQIVKNVSPIPKQASALHTRTKSLTSDPFDSHWVDEINNIPTRTEPPIISHTNPFITSVKSIDS